MWVEAFRTAYALGVLEARLALPKLGALPWGAAFDAEGLFNNVVASLPSSSDGKWTLEAAARADLK